MDLEGQSDKALAYVTFRLSLGIGELMHGLVRLPILATFAADMAKGFRRHDFARLVRLCLWVGASVFGGADRNLAYSRVAHKMGT